MQLLVDGEWLEPKDAYLRMMFKTLRRIAVEDMTLREIDELVMDTLSFVGDGASAPSSATEPTKGVQA